VFLLKTNLYFADWPRPEYWCIWSISRSSWSLGIWRPSPTHWMWVYRVA